MKLEFTKMQALGNDFVVINAIKQQLHLTSDNIRFIADRRFGVGCDQVLLLQLPVRDAKVDFFCRIYNADGGEAEQSGNGMRCIAKYVYDNGLTDKRQFVIGTMSAMAVVQLQDDGRVTVDLGVPVLQPEHIPFVAQKQQLRYRLAFPGIAEQEVGVVALGNPHAIIQVDDVASVAVDVIGKIIATASYFPKGINVGFMEVVDRQHIKLRVYERGTGETLACGSNACAAVVIGRLWQLVAENVEVAQPGGVLAVMCTDMSSSVFLTGVAAMVFVGVIWL